MTLAVDWAFKPQTKQNEYVVGTRDQKKLIFTISVYKCILYNVNKIW